MLNGIQVLTKEIIKETGKVKTNVFSTKKEVAAA